MADVQIVTVALSDGTQVQVVAGTPLHELYLALAGFSTTASGGLPDIDLTTLRTMAWFMTPFGPQSVVEPATITEFRRRDYLEITAQQAADFFAGAAEIPDVSFITGQELQAVLDGRDAAPLPDSRLPARLSDDALSAAFGRVYTPEAHGAAGDGTTNDTAAVQAALDAVPSTGGVVLLTGRYYCPTGVTASKRTKILGAGAGGLLSFSSASGIFTDSTTAVALTLAATGCVVEDVAVINTSTTPTAGAGIKLTAGNGAQLSRVLVSGFYDNVDLSAGFYWNMTDCTLLDPVRYAFYHHNTTPNGDWGDGSIKGGVIACLNKARNPAAAIRWESGGGLKITGIKINGAMMGTDGTTPAGMFVLGLDLAVADGVATSVLLVTGNSIENCSSVCAQIRQAGTTGQFGKIAITGNELNNAAYGVVLTSSSAATNADIGTAVIADNVFTAFFNSIAVNDVSNVHIGTNVHQGIGGPSVALNGTNTDVHVDSQIVQGENKTLWYDEGATNEPNGHGPYAMSRFVLEREVPTTTSETTYTNLYRLSVGQYSAGVIEVNLGGNVADAGPYTYQGRFTYLRAAPGTAVTATAVGTPVTAGTQVDVILDTATTNGDILVGVRLHSGSGGTDVCGRASVVVDGPMFQVIKGA